jgi:hypothetical protein
VQRPRLLPSRRSSLFLYICHSSLGSRHKSSTRFSNEAAVWHTAARCVYISDGFDCPCHLHYIVVVVVSSSSSAWSVVWVSRSTWADRQDTKAARVREREIIQPNRTKTAKRWYESTKDEVVAGVGTFVSRFLRVDARAWLPHRGSLSSYAIKASQVETLGKWDRRSRTY